MRESFEREVVAWPTSSPEQRAYGRLTYEPTAGVSLAVIDADWAAARDAPGYWPAIHGENFDGVPFSLLRVFRRRAGGSLFTTHTRADLGAEVLLGGVHVESEDEVAVTQVGLGFHGLREWLTSAHRDRDGALPLPPDLHERSPRPELEVEVEGTRLVFYLWRKGNGTRFRSQSDVQAAIALYSPEPLTLTAWRKRWHMPLRDLLIFGNREQTTTSDFNAFYPREHGRRPTVTLVERAETQLAPETVLSFYQRDLLPAGAVDDVGPLIQRWFALHRKLDDASTFFFGTLNAASLPDENRLLNLLSFAETYHRRLHDAPPFTADEHSAHVQAMLAALPDDHAREVYDSALNFANRQTQRERVRELIERAFAVDWRFEELSEVFEKHLMSTRNRLTHWGRAERWALSGADLGLVVDRLIVVLEANILLDLGLNEDAVAECLAHGYVWDDPLPLPEPDPDDAPDDDLVDPD